MATTDQTLSEFIDAWNSGERPSVHDYLDRVGGNDRDRLAGLIEAFLENAAVPPYTEEQRRAIAGEPGVAATLRLVEGPGGLWPALLPKLRRRARITRQQLVKQLADALGLSGREARVELYYHQMETGSLDPSGVSQRVLDALARIFSVAADELAAAGDFSRPPAPAGQLYYRTDGLPASPGDVSETPVASQAVEPLEGWDEVDQLFRGGR